jgi:hypothetical protein
MFHGVVEGEINCLIYRCEIPVDFNVKALHIPAEEKIPPKLIVMFILCLDSKLK